MSPSLCDNPPLTYHPILTTDYYRLLTTVYYITPPPLNPAPSLHVGSLLQIMILRHYQRSGGTPYVLIGGGTSAIGDPTGKDQSRKMLNAEDIRRNTEGICGVFEKFLEFGEGEGQAKMVDNSDWLSGLNYMNFLRDYGPMFTVNRMLSFESVKQRLAREAPLSFLEFNYMILQSYDFLELYRRHNVTLQLGGSDQWGNMVSGVDLIRKCKQTKTFALTAPLVTTASGKKMGKTEGGAVWLNKSQLSEFQYWQFWRNTDDGDVGKFLRLFTDLPMDEIERLELLEGKDINKAKEVLADEATAMLHGRDCLDGIHSSLQGMFGSSSSSSSSPDASAIDATGLPSISVAQPTKLIDALILLSFASSKKESRRLIEGGGAKVDGIKVQDTMHVIEFEGKEEVVIGAGKKRAGVLRLEK